MVNKRQSTNKPLTSTDNKGTAFAKIPKTVVALAIINIAIIVLVFIINKQLPPELPLFYGLAYGKEQLALSHYLVIPSVVALIIILVNTVISYFLEDSFLKTTLLITDFAVTFFSIITTIKIVLLIGSF